MASATPMTATEILGEVIRPLAPSFAPAFSELVLQMHMSDLARERIRELLDRNNAGMLEPAEKTALDNYLLVGQFLDLLQAKARLALKAGSNGS